MQPHNWLLFALGTAARADDHYRSSKDEPTVRGIFTAPPTLEHLDGSADKVRGVSRNAGLFAAWLPTFHL